MPQGSSRGAQLQLIIFRLAEEEFAVPIGEVREIIRSVPVTPVPGPGEFVRGMINVRGEIAVVVDLKRRFALSGVEAGPKHFVITAQGRNLFAFLVDEVTEILRISPEDLKPSPEIATEVDQSFLKGFVVREARLIALLDIAKVLSEEALAATAEAGRLGPR